MTRISLAAATACIALLSSCGSQKRSDPSPQPSATPVATAPAPAPAASSDGPPGHESNSKTDAAADAYLASDAAKGALAAPPPDVAGLPAESLSKANELAVCRVAFAVRHGESARAPSDVERRTAPFDLATNPKALEECQARG